MSSIYDEKANLDSKRAVIVEREAALRDVTDKLLPFAEIDVKLDGCVDQRGQRCLDTARGLFFGPTSLARLGETNTGLAVERLSAFDMRCALHPDEMKADLKRLARLVIEAKNTGLPSAERPARLEAARAELETLEAEEAALVDQLIAAGLKVEHRGKEINRRRHAATQLAREAEQAAAEQKNRRYYYGAYLKGLPVPDRWRQEFEAQELQMESK